MSLYANVAKFDWSWKHHSWSLLKVALFASLSATQLSSQKIWETTTLRSLANLKALFHLLSKSQGIFSILYLHKLTTYRESDSTQRLFQLNSWAFLIARMIAIISASKANSTPRDQAKHPFVNPRQVLNIPSHLLLSGEPKADPSMLHLIQPWRGGFQWTSVIVASFGGRRIKSQS